MKEQKRSNKKMALDERKILDKNDSIATTDMGLRDLVATKCCKHVDIGTAVMPALLFDELAKNGYSYMDSTPKQFGTTTATRYAEIVRREFNAVVSIIPWCYTSLSLYA
jgi:hypothetical protein